jgi:hypothetical protein
MKRSALFLLLAAALPLGAGTQASVSPNTGLSFPRLERSVNAGVDLGQAQSDIDLALPAGLPLVEAERRLRLAGAQCPDSGDNMAVIQCSYELPVVTDGDAAMAINWTTRLSLDRQRIASVSVSRSVDMR